MFPGIDLEFLENVSPDCLHVVPVLNHAVIHRVAQLQDALEFFLQSKDAKSTHIISQGFFPKVTISILSYIACYLRLVTR